MKTIPSTLVLLLTMSGALAAGAQDAPTDRSGAQPAAKAASKAPVQRAQRAELDPRSHSYGLHARHDFRSTKTREEVRAELEEARSAAGRGHLVVTSH
jgi:hypothetical protein